MATTYPSRVLSAPPRDYAGRDCPEPPATPSDPEPERGHWCYGEWIDDDAEEWEPEWEGAK